MLPGEIPPVPVPAKGLTRLTGSETSDAEAGSDVFRLTLLVPHAVRAAAASMVTRAGAHTAPTRVCGRLTPPTVTGMYRIWRGRRRRDDEDVTDGD
jgi:hypothetical protein